MQILLFSSILSIVVSLCKKTPTTSLFLFLNQSFTKSKLLGFKNFESLVFGAFLLKTEKTLVFLLALFTQDFRFQPFVVLRIQPHRKEYQS